MREKLNLDESDEFTLKIGNARVTITRAGKRFTLGRATIQPEHFGISLIPVTREQPVWANCGIEPFVMEFDVEVQDLALAGTVAEFGRARAQGIFSNPIAGGGIRMADTTAEMNKLTPLFHNKRMAPADSRLRFRRFEFDVVDEAGKPINNNGIFGAFAVVI